MSGGGGGDLSGLIAAGTGMAAAPATGGLSLLIPALTSGASSLMGSSGGSGGGGLSSLLSQALSLFGGQPGNAPQAPQVLGLPQRQPGQMLPAIGSQSVAPKGPLTGGMSGGGNISPQVMQFLQQLMGKSGM
jgi:hypothetical protein